MEMIRRDCTTREAVLLELQQALQYGCHRSCPCRHDNQCCLQNLVDTIGIESLTDKIVNTRLETHQKCPTQEHMKQEIGSFLARTSAAADGSASLRDPVQLFDTVVCRWSYGLYFGFSAAQIRAVIRDGVGIDRRRIKQDVPAPKREALLAWFSTFLDTHLLPTQDPESGMQTIRFVAFTDWYVLYLLDVDVLSAASAPSYSYFQVR